MAKLIYLFTIEAQIFICNRARNLTIFCDWTKMISLISRFTIRSLPQDLLDAYDHGHLNDAVLKFIVSH
jgi:hypothetical protein